VHQHVRCKVNRRPESNRRSLIQISINNRPVTGRGGADANALARSQLSLASRRRLFVAVERIELSRARVWAATVHQHGLRYADEVRCSGCWSYQDPPNMEFGNRAPTARKKLHTRANRRPVFHSRALRTTERTRTSANNLRSVASHPWNGGIRQPSRSGGNRTLRSFAPNERIEAGLALSIFVSPEITAMSRIPGGNCTRTNGSRDRWTAVIQQGQTRRAREWTSGGSWESRRSYWAP
jgi:hypothetical protein